jgi:DNA polymerase-3 subunit alpha
MGEADILRWAMSKKVKSEMARHKERFLAGGKTLGISAAKAKEIFGLIEQFAEYGFNKSHSAAYAMVAYQTAYLKAHHPVEYMAALLSLENDKSDKILRYISDCGRMHIKVEPPDINKSFRDFTVAGDRIRFGLGAVKNLGEAAIEGILSVREEKGPFRSLKGFCSRVDMKKVNRKVIESLIKCGAFDSLGGHRAQLLKVLDETMEAGGRYQEEKESGQRNLFEDGLGGQEEFAEPLLPDLPEWSHPERLSYEKESLGLYLSGHPLLQYELDLRRHGAIRTRKLLQLRETTEVAIGGFITSRKDIQTKKGERMAFLTVEDQEGRVEVIVFPDVYKECSSFLSEDTPVVIRGSLELGEEEEDEEEERRRPEERRRLAKILASKVLPLSEMRSVEDRSVHVTLHTQEVTKSKLEELKDIVLEFRGQCPIYLHLLEPTHRQTTLEVPKEYYVRPCVEFFERVERLFGHSIVQIH